MILLDNTFETEEYKLSFEQRTYDVLISVCRVDGRDITDDDINNVKGFFEDIGKWETLIRSAINLLEDLNIVKVDERTKGYFRKEFGKEKYILEEMDVPRWETCRFSIRLDPKERHLREARNQNGILSVEEIILQIKNIPKWKNLTKTTRSVKVSVL